MKYKTNYYAGTYPHAGICPPPPPPPPFFFFYFQLQPEPDDEDYGKDSSEA